MDSFYHKKDKYLTMDSKKIRALLTIAESKSITSAAEKLGYTQPGLTNMMNSLEAELGLELLVRGKSGARLSQYALELLPFFNSFLEADRELVSSAERIIEKYKYSLRIGAYSSVARLWLPSILSNYRGSNVKTETELTVTGIRSLYGNVRDGQLDCAIVSLQEELIGDLGWIPLHSDELLAVVPLDLVWNRDDFPVEKFDREEFLMPSGGFDMDILPALNGGGHQSGAIIRYTNLDDAAIISMVSHDLGFSILSELVVQGIAENVRLLKLSPPTFRELGIIISPEWESDANLRNFVRCAQETVDTMYA